MNKRREKGKSHSTRPVTPNEVLLSKINPEEVKTLVIDLAKKGYPPSMIGIILRDQHGVPLVRAVTGKKITEILREAGLAPEIPEDLANLIRRAERVLRHLEEHPKDKRSVKGLEEIISKINRLKKYYKRVGRLPPDWDYKIKVPK